MVKTLSLQDYPIGMLWERRKIMCILEGERNKESVERRGERRKKHGGQRKLLHVALLPGKLLDFVYFFKKIHSNL